MSGAHEKQSAATWWPKNANKAVVAIMGFIGSLIAQGAVHGTALHYLAAGVAGLTAIGVWAVPNYGYTPPGQTSTPVAPTDTSQP